MILFTIMVIMLLAAILVGAAIIGVSGIALIIPFADVIVCVLLIVWLVKLLIKRKK